ncbi:MAG: hypothetical protein F4142_06790 [Nitrospira sp. SB0675_bin_23]|nr:hypothetical protein [Nitrospira sp. SB0675_bin_23]
MRRTYFTLILLVAWLIGSLPGTSLALERPSIMGPATSALAVQKMRAKRRLEVRQERTDARQEVLFWFRTHPHEGLLPQAVVDEMVQSGGYRLEVVKWLAGARNPFFEEFRFSPEAEELLKEAVPDSTNPSSPCGTPAP